MAERKKWPSVDGILYAKSPIRKVTSKDKNGDLIEYEFQSIILEIDGSYTNRNGEYVKKVCLMEFDLSKNAKAAIDRFNQNDPITVTYTWAGREYKKKDGTKGYDNKLSAYTVEFSTIDSGNFKTKPLTKEMNKKETIPAPVPPDDDDDPISPF